MSSTKWLSKITASNKDYYLLVTEAQHQGQFESFDIALCDGENAWCGTVTDDNLERFSKKVHMDYDDMLTQTKKALTKDNVGSMNFQYQVKSSGDTIQFQWKKHIVAESIKFQLGSADLTQKPDPTDVIKLIFNHAISSVGELQEQINNLQSDNQRLVSERASALKRFEKYLSAKDSVEQDLYSKFVIVINDKKSKLRELQQENEALRAGGTSASISDGGDVGPSSKRSARDMDGQSEDESDNMSEREDDTSRVKVKQEYDSEYNTDEDDKPTSKPPAKKQKKVKQEPLDTSGETSLMLDMGDNEDDDIPVTGRRSRQRAGSGKKQTPSKPIIPKVPSSEQKVTPGPSRSRPGRSSMRKSASILSNRSSDQIDDLIDDF